MNNDFICSKRKSAEINLANKMFDKHLSNRYKSIGVIKKQELNCEELDNLLISSFILEGSNINLLSLKQQLIFLNQIKNEHF